MKYIRTGISATAFALTILSNVAFAEESHTAKREAPQTVRFEKGPFDVRVERSHFVTMRDGVRLSMDLYFPQGYHGKLPVILERTPYDKAARRKVDFAAPIMNSNQAYYYASHGYIVAVQDRRGKFESEGDYTIGYGDINDAHDTLDWFQQQSWFNGNVGMIGCSIPGGNVIRAAMSQHPTLKGLVPQSAAFAHGTAGGTMARGFLRGGVQNMTMPLWAHVAGSKIFYRPSKRLEREEFLKIVDHFNPAPSLSASFADFIDPQTGELKKDVLDTLMSLPVVDIDEKLGSLPSDWDDMAASPPMGEFWTNGDYLDDNEKVEGGALHINSWHDYGANETILQFLHFQKNAVSDWARENQYLIMGPLSHCNIESVSNNMKNGERDIGDARFDVWGTYKKWWDYSLKNEANGFQNTPKIQYFLYGANEWRSANQWPIAGTQPKRIYLTSAGEANTRLGNGKLAWGLPKFNLSDSYVYDPANPVINLRKGVQSGSFDQSELELRDDILVYTSDPLPNAVEMTGKMRAKVWLSADVPDTDLAVKILDVYPDGRAFSIQEGYLRLRYREGFDKEVMMETGVIYPIDLDLLVGANLFKPGHRIRIEITSSNFPNYMRNLNTGGDSARDTLYKKANIKIHHGTDYPSYIELPIINRELTK